MKNESLKQANILMNWLEMNDIQTNDVIVTIMLENGKTYKAMNDGSIVQMSADDNDNKAFANAQELIALLESKQTKSNDAIFKIKMPLQNINSKFHATSLDAIQKVFDDMTVDSVDDSFAYLTYNGNESEEPETVDADIRLKYGVKPFSIKKS